MSMEQAITDHAAAIRELAAAIRGAASSNLGGVPLTIHSEVCSTLAEAAELEAAVTQVETDPLLDDAPVELDYEKDVKPLLVKVGKDKQQLVDLLGKFNAKNGARIAKADYPAVVAAANKIIGG